MQNSAPPSSNAPVLIVEDNEACAQNLAQTLEALGHPCYLAPSAEAALPILEQRHAALHCVILDLGLPGMPGDALHALTTRRWPNLRVVLCTADHESSVRARHPQLSWRGFLGKPFAPEEVRTTLSALDPCCPRTPRSWWAKN